MLLSHIGQNGGPKGMEVEEIKSLIEVFERTSLTELELQRGESRLVLKRSPSSGSAAHQPVMAQIHTASEPATQASPTHQERQKRGSEDGKSAAGGFVIEAPIVGTFYRRPAPEEDPYVEIGDRVNPGDTVCLVEAMKVMNEVRTERAGVVKDVLVQDGKPVEYGQPLILLDLFDS